MKILVTDGITPEGAKILIDAGHQRQRSRKKSSMQEAT
jgi:hypothetical protein